MRVSFESMEPVGGVPHTFPMGKLPGRLEVFIRAWRKARGMTQAQLAEKVDLSEGQLSKIEQNTSDIGLINLRKFAEALDCDEFDLLSRPPSAHPKLWTIYREADEATRDELDQIAQTLVAARQKRGRR